MQQTALWQQFLFCIILVNGDLPKESSSVHLLLLQCCSCMISFTVLAVTPNPLVHNTQHIQVVRAPIIIFQTVNLVCA